MNEQPLSTKFLEKDHLRAIEMSQRNRGHVLFKKPSPVPALH